jgi:Ser/Thr protein kinase RdoA (MazF antagonist)
VTRFVEGTTIDWESAPWQQIGELLGRLHASFHQSPLLEALPIAERSLEQELQLSLADLESVAAALPPQFAATYAELLRAIQTTQRWNHLPQTLIHNDYHPGNILRAPDGALTAIDWDGAGTSPPILDLGFVLSSSHPRHAQRPDPARINALVDGYCQQHHLTHAELGGLFDAVRFRPIAFLTSELPLMVADPGWHHPDYRWWQARYEASVEIAALACACFERYI